MGGCYSDKEKRMKYKNNLIGIKNDIIYNNKYRINCHEIQGFYNIGNSCYMNSFLQILLHIPNFLDNLKKEYQKSNKKSPLIESIINLSEYSNNKNNLHLIQKYMKKISPNYAEFHQADSQNFGIDLITEIITSIKGVEEFSSQYQNRDNEEIMNISMYKKNKYKEYIQKYQNKDTQISLEKMFTINEYQNYFDSNGISNITFISSFNIDLSFQKNNQNEYSEEYNLQDLLYYKYNKKFETCYKKENNYMQIENILKICKLPKIVIITILRSETGEKLKTQKLKFPNKIDFSDYIDKDLINKKNLKYKLFAINEKNGESKSNGHYYSFLKIDKNWYLYDDEKIIEKEPNFVSNNVVGLFYEEYH